MIVNKIAPRVSSSGHILIVEDDTLNREILAALLQRAGYIVDSAENGEEAWNRLMHRSDYTLVVTDRLMPQMDGLQLFTRIKRSANLRHIPVIMQTGATSASEIAEGVQSGVYYYLTKPYQEETLLSLVKSAIHDQNTSNHFSEKLKKHQDTLHNMQRGVFDIRTPEQAQNIAFLLGSLFPKPETATTGLYELLLNAIEHGNLQIGYETKKALMANGTWENEITRRLELQENKNKSVRIEYALSNNMITVTITDSGTGFDWHPFLQIEPSRATQANGRGIAKANLLSFEKMAFRGNGNEVVLTQSL